MINIKNILNFQSYLVWKNRKKKVVIVKDEKRVESEEVTKEVTKEAEGVASEADQTADEYYDKILTMLKEHKRLTQKEIRKDIPLSEAKISLIISEMEHKGLVEKIKKGRGNIIVLK